MHGLRSIALDEQGIQMPIGLEVQDGLATIRLQRSSVRNALRLQEWLRLAECFETIEQAGVHVVILTGQKHCFCAGADLTELAQLSYDLDGRPRFREAMRRGLNAVGNSPVPVIAFVDGDCHGAGVALAMACDIRVVSPTSRFSMPPARLGITYPQADVTRLVQLVGKGQAARILLSGLSLDADEALRIGLADIMDESAHELARAIADNDAASVAILRRQISGMAESDADQFFDASFGSKRFADAAFAIRKRTNRKSQMAE